MRRFTFDHAAESHAGHLHESGEWAALLSGVALVWDSLMSWKAWYVHFELDGQAAENRTVDVGGSAYEGGEETPLRIGSVQDTNRDMIIRFEELRDGLR